MNFVTHYCASYNLRDRVEKSSLKEREHEDTQALQQFHGIVSKIEELQLEIGQFNGASSEDVLRTQISEIESLKTDLDEAYKKVRTTTLSPVSSRMHIKTKQLRDELDMLSSELQPHENLASMEAVNTNIVLSSSIESKTMKSDESYSIEMTSKNIKHSSGNKKHSTTCNKSTCSTHTSAQDNSESEDAKSECSHDTIQYYLKNQYDVSEDQHKFVTAPQLNIFDMSAILAEYINASMLHVPEPITFNSNPLDYPSWKTSFNTLIESNNIKASEKIYLKIYLHVDVKLLIECTSFFDDDHAFERANELLDKRFGNSFLISESIRDKLYNLKIIKENYSFGLRAFADYLQQCNMATEHISGLNILNDCRENRKMLTKLPKWLIRRWRRIVSKYTHSYPSFSEFCLFVNKEADIICNPILCSLQETEDERIKPAKKIHVQRTFATGSQEDRENCYLCKKYHHALEDCRVFKNKSFEERREFIITNGICFSCLKKGHISKQCLQRLSCSKCRKRHPTSLCGDFKNWKQKSSHLHNEDSVSNGSSMKVSISNVTDLTTMIVPVFVSSEDSIEPLMVYALLDSQSDSTFILDSVAEELKARSVDVDLKLSTMTTTSTIKCQKIKNLRIRGFYSEKILSIPTAYTRDVIPISRFHIPTNMTASKWSHLQCLKNKIPVMQNCKIGMLIGYNCSLAIKPIDVISGRDDEPYGVKTILGWSIVGTSSSEPVVTHYNSITTKVPDNMKLAVSHTNQAHFVFRTSCKEIINILESDFIEKRTDNYVMSQHDMKFMKIMNNEIRRDEQGFYEMPLPFKTENPILPNSRNIAEKRLDQLKRRLGKSKVLYDDYKAFIEMLFEKHYAEICLDIEEKSDVEWYIPHYTVYNPKKSSSARVVFDCAAVFHNKSLNACLIQGPDLLNSLICSMPVP